jgi:histidine triad (HIT) family protein
MLKSSNLLAFTTTVNSFKNYEFTLGHFSKNSFLYLNTPLPKSIQSITITLINQFTAKKQKPYNLQNSEITMALTPEQAEAIKEQLLKQLDNFPEDKRQQIQEKILSMTLEEVEVFVKENQLAHMQQSPSQSATGCIFCNIASKSIPSFPLDEDKDNLAVLEINPLSKGHSMVIPKKHLETQNIPASTFKIAKKIAKKIKDRFQPKEIKISAQKILSHSLIEVLPLYGNETERKKATDKELKQLQEELKIVKKPKRERKPKTVKQSSSPKLPRLKPRIP